MPEKLDNPTLSTGLTKNAQLLIKCKATRWPLFALLVVPIGLMMFAPSAQAQKIATFEHCQQKAAGVTLEVRKCLASEFRRQDELLNSAYQGLVKSLSQRLALRLRDAQRQWLATRGTECALLGDVEGGGTLAALLIDRCILDRTEAHVRFLKQMQAVNGN